MKKLLLSFLLLSAAAFSHAATETAIVFAEDFDAMTAGTNDEPDGVEISADKKVDTALTHGLQWQGRGLHQAGGAVALLHFDEGAAQVQGYIQTPYIDVRLDHGRFTARFRAKAHGSETAAIHVELYDPYTTNSIDAATTNISSEWKTYEVALTHPGYGNHLAFLQMASEGDDWLMDDFEIVQNYYALMPPVTHFAKDVTYEQFTAYWNPVPLADSYLLSTFTLGDNGNREYLGKDVPVDGCQYTVTGTEKGKDYYYVVRSVNAQYKSPESDPRQVHVALTSLDVPQVLDATDIEADGFTAHWEPVFRAMGYIVSLTREHIAQADESFVILHEDFEKCTGYSDYPDYPSPFYYNLDDYTSMPGWGVPASPVSAQGKFGIDNYWKQYEGEGILTSPVLDLSGTSGRFSVTMKVVATKGNTVAVECGDVKKTYKLTAAKEQFTLSFENGTSESVLKFSFDGNATLLFDDIIISQEIHAGDAVVENVGNFNTAEDYKYPTEEARVTQYAFNGLNAHEGDIFIYKVKAWSWSLGEDGIWGPTIYSDLSEPKRVEIAKAGIEDTADTSLSVTVDGTNIRISAPESTTVEIFDMSGRLCSACKIPSGTTILPRPAPGAYILRAASRTAKLLIP